MLQIFLRLTILIISCFKILTSLSTSSVYLYPVGSHFDIIVIYSLNAVALPTLHCIWGLRCRCIVQARRQDWNGSELPMQKFFKAIFAIEIRDKSWFGIRNDLTHFKHRAGLKETLIQGMPPLYPHALYSVDKPSQFRWRSQYRDRTDSANNNEMLTYSIQKQLPYFLVASMVSVFFLDLVFFARFVFFAVCIAFVFYASFWSNVWHVLAFFFADVLFFAISFFVSFVRAFDCSDLQFVKKSRSYRPRARMAGHETHSQNKYACHKKYTEEGLLIEIKRMFI